MHIESSSWTWPSLPVFVPFLISSSHSANYLASAVVASRCMFTCNQRIWMLSQRWECWMVALTISSRDPFWTIGSVWRKLPPRMTVIPPKGQSMPQRSWRVWLTGSTAWWCWAPISSQIIASVTISYYFSSYRLWTTFSFSHSILGYVLSPSLHRLFIIFLCHSALHHSCIPVIVTHSICNSFLLLL